MKVKIECILTANAKLEDVGHSPSESTDVDVQVKFHFFYKDNVSVPEGVVTNKKNSGGQIWNWADANWDSFIPKQVAVPSLEGPTGEPLMADVSWVCVTGVYAAGSDKLLPVAAVNYRSKGNLNRGNAIKKTKKKKVALEVDDVALEESSGSTHPKVRSPTLERIQRDVRKAVSNGEVTSSKPSAKKKTRKKKLKEVDITDMSGSKSVLDTALEKIE